MKKALFLMFGLSLLFGSFSQPLHAEAPRLTPECMEQRKARDEQFTQQVIKDVISSFQLDIDEHQYIEVSARDLDAANMIYGGKEKDEYYDSLKKHFFVATRGNPRLFVRPQEAYVLYKKPDNTNVMVHLKLEKARWEVTGRNKKKGREIPYKLLPCEIDYLKKKKEFYSQ